MTHTSRSSSVHAPITQKWTLIIAKGIVFVLGIKMDTCGKKFREITLGWVKLYEIQILTFEIFRDNFSIALQMNFSCSLH